MDGIMIFPSSLERSETLNELAAVSRLDVALGPEFSRPPPQDPQMVIDPGLSVTSFTPGCYANVIQNSLKARHARQMIRENTTSSFILNLAPDGAATVCRGWRYLFFNDGPQVHTNEYIREQLGYRGRWEHKEDWVNVDVNLDNTVCPRVGQFSYSTEWHLRCLQLVLKKYPLLTMPILACQFANLEPGFSENQPHVVPEILPGEWIVLGAGNGLRINVASSSIDRDEAPVVRVEYCAEPVRTDAWEHSI